MREQQDTQRTRLLGSILLLVMLAGCRLTPGAQADTSQGLRITPGEAYAGVKDGIVESVPLPEGSAYVTVEACVENRSAVERSVGWRDVYLMTGENVQVYPVALGHDQAEAFSWLLPIIEPIGGKHIDHKFYFFRIQNNELMRIPAYQSVGCRGSSQFTSMAFLFLVPGERAAQSHTLQFFEETLELRPGTVVPIPVFLPWGIGLGGLVAFAALAAVRLRQRKRQAQASAAHPQGQDDPGES